MDRMSSDHTQRRQGVFTAKHIRRFHAAYLWRRGKERVRDVSGAPLSTTNLQGAPLSAIDPSRASAQGF